MHHNLIKIKTFFWMLFLPLFLFSQVPEQVEFTTADGGRISADWYPGGKRAVILAHGAIFNKESWRAQAKQLVSAGISVLAINFRGYGKSIAGKNRSALEEDVLGAVNYLNELGYDTVSVLGASMGGGACARAAVKASVGKIYKLLLLSPVPIPHPEKMKAEEIIYIASKKEGMAEDIQKQFSKIKLPKRIFWIPGSAHAQHIFRTNQSQYLIRLIIRLLKE